MHVVEVDTEFCDACDPDAYVKSLVFAQLPSGRSISYCYHHGNAYFTELAKQAVIMIDLRYTIEPDNQHGH